MIAPDGKALRRSFDHLNDRAAAHGLGAFATDAALLLAHHEVPAAPDEIPAARALIEALGVTGVLFTAAAPHCQKTFRCAAEAGNARLVRVKGNQPGLHDALIRLCAERAAFDRHETVDRHRRGRREHRRVGVFDPGGRPEPEWRPLLACVARVTRLTWGQDTRSGLWTARQEVACYACQVRLDAAAFGRAVRAHWGIENRAHHVRDRILREDDSRIRTRPGVCARLRSFAVNILRANGVGNISGAIHTNALSLDRLLACGITQQN